ncbi:MAG: ACP S-malonyltransferase, partial [Candidatus Kapaibacteriota bacterium]
AKTSFRNAKVPVYLNVTAKAETKAEIIKEALIQQLTSPVRWTQTIQNMYNDGIRRFIEVGAGNVLQGLVKRTVTDCEIIGLDKAEDLNNFFKNLR